MKTQLSKKIAKLKKTATKTENWEQVEPFNLTRPTSIRLSPGMVKELKRLADLHGERSYQSLLKKWVAERVSYETHLIELGKNKYKAG